jgi:hypothetical protein
MATTRGHARGVRVAIQAKDRRPNRTFMIDLAVLVVDFSLRDRRRISV